MHDGPLNSTKSTIPWGASLGVNPIKYNAFSVRILTFSSKSTAFQPFRSLQRAVFLEDISSLLCYPVPLTWNIGDGGVFHGRRQYLESKSAMES